MRNTIISTCTEILFSIHRWMDIITDIGCVNPDFLDIRRLEKGMQRRKAKKAGGNLHCIMAFSKCKFQTIKTYRTQIPVFGGKGGGKDSRFKMTNGNDDSLTVSQKEGSGESGVQTVEPVQTSEQEVQGNHGVNLDEGHENGRQVVGKEEDFEDDDEVEDLDTENESSENNS